MLFAGKKYTGKGVRVAIVDTGIQHNSSNVIASWDIFLGRSGKLSIQTGKTDVIGRGTQLAQAVLSKAPNVQLIGINIFNEKAKTNSDILAAGIDYAIGQGVDIICVCANTQNKEKYAKFKRIIKWAEQQDVMVVANSVVSKKNVYPASIKPVIPVQSHPRIVHHLLYCDPIFFPETEYQEAGMFLGNGYLHQHFRGGEFAAAYVAGMLACLKEARPENTAEEIVAVLQQKAFLPTEELTDILHKKTVTTDL